jgi:hypothetical protein
MAETENRERVLLLTEQYRILGDMQLGPDGSLWDFKHRTDEKFLLMYEALFFDVADGKRIFDAEQVEVNKDYVIAVFREADVAFMRKE